MLKRLWRRLFNPLIEVVGGPEPIIKHSVFDAERAAFGRALANPGKEFEVRVNGKRISAIRRVR